jgi:hypothetical protein
LAAIAVKLRFIDLKDDDTSQNSMITELAGKMNEGNTNIEKFSKQWAQDKAHDIASVWETQSLMQKTAKSDPIEGSLGHPGIPEEMKNDEIKMEEHLKSLKHSLDWAEKSIGAKLDMKIDPENEAPPTNYNSKDEADRIAADYDLDEDVRQSEKSVKLVENQLGYNTGEWRYESVEVCDWGSPDGDNFFEDSSKKCRKVMKKVPAPDWFSSLSGASSKHLDKEAVKEEKALARDSAKDDSKSNRHDIGVEDDNKEEKEVYNPWGSIDNPVGEDVKGKDSKKEGGDDAAKDKKEEQEPKEKKAVDPAEMYAARKAKIDAKNSLM